MKLNFFSLSIAVLLVTLTGCEKDNSVSATDQLEQIGILGKWKLEVRTVNNITPLIIQCCDTIAFMRDNEPGDLKGEFRSTGAGYETNGIFEISTVDSTIFFAWNNSQRLYEFQLSGNVLTFEYTEDEQEVSEDWYKVE